jgi:hypothetical protein
MAVVWDIFPTNAIGAACCLPFPALPITVINYPLPTPTQPNPPIRGIGPVGFPDFPIKRKGERNGIERGVGFIFVLSHGIISRSNDNDGGGIDCLCSLCLCILYTEFVARKFDG